MGCSKASFAAMGLCAIAMTLTMIVGGVTAQGPASSPATDCVTVVLTLSDCLPFVMAQATTPPATCCSNLSAVIENHVDCLCQLYNTTFTEPLGINVTQAQKLPSACKLTTPPPSSCTALGVPVPGPVASAGPSMEPVSPSTTPSPASTPMAPTPVSSPSAPSPSATPVPATAPSGATVPVGAASPPATTAASPPNPSGAPLGVMKGAVACASLFAALVLAFF